MPTFDVIAILLTLAAVFGYVNFRYIKLPTTIGIMLLGLLFSLLVIVVGKFSPAITETAILFVAGIEFNEALLGIMLSYLLFAGALHVNPWIWQTRKGLLQYLRLLALSSQPLSLVASLGFYSRQWE